MGGTVKHLRPPLPAHFRPCRLTCLRDASRRTVAFVWPRPLKAPWAPCDCGAASLPRGAPAPPQVALSPWRRQCFTTCPQLGSGRIPHVQVDRVLLLLTLLVGANGTSTRGGWQLSHRGSLTTRTGRPFRAACVAALAATMAASASARGQASLLLMRQLKGTLAFPWWCRATRRPLCGQQC